MSPDRKSFSTRPRKELRPPWQRFYLFIKLTDVCAQRDNPLLQAFGQFLYIKEQAKGGAFCIHAQTGSTMKVKCRPDGKAIMIQRNSGNHSDA
jgi:hypothetical protein